MEDPTQYRQGPAQSPADGPAQSGRDGRAQPRGDTQAQFRSDAQAHAGGASTGMRRGWRWAGYAALAAVMALGFWGYFSPGMRLNWETLVALCGF